MSGSAQRRVLYQRFGAGGAFDCIDDGYLAGYTHAGCAVHAWADRAGEPTLAEMIALHDPTHLVLCLHNPDRTLCRWTDDGSLATALRSGAHLSARMNPPEITEYFRGSGIDFDRFREFGVSSFYTRPPGLTSDERRVLGSGAISLVRSPLAAEAIGACFRSVLDMGVPVLEEPHAADIWRYPHAGSDPEPRFAASFVGRCWPFKWSHMEPYIDAMQHRFGDRFAVFGSGWPEGVSDGPIDDSGFVRAVRGSSVCLSLHEPTQVMAKPFAQNERVFKLLAMGACVVSDNNPMLRGQFEVGEELLLAPAPAAMVELTERMIAEPGCRRSITAAGRTRVLAEHTYAHRAQRLLAVAADPPVAGSIVTRLGEASDAGVNVG